MAKPNKKILLVKYRYLGDAILAIPAFAAIRQTFPDAQIDLLAEPIIAQLFEENPWNISTIVIRDVRKARTLYGLLKLALKLRKSKYDISCNFIHEFTIKDSLLPFLSGIPLRAGFSVKGKGFLFTNRIKIEGHQFISHHGHMSDINAMIPKAIGVKVNDCIPRLWVHPKSKSYVKLLLNEYQIRRPIVGIHPHVQDTIRLWPKEYFSEVIKFLIDNYNVDVVCTGSPNEAAYCEDLVKLTNRKHVYSMAGKTTVSQLIALINEMKLYLVGTTGTMHVSASLGVPLIAIRGADEAMWDPVGEGVIIQLKDTSVRPCYDKLSPDAQAYMNVLRNITPQMVIAKIKSIDRCLK